MHTSSAACHAAKYAALRCTDQWQHDTGVPFQESKRRPLIPLLYVQHALMVAMVAFNCYGTYAISHRPASYCQVETGGLLNPFNATTAVVCTMWGIILIFLCAPRSAVECRHQLA